MTAVELHPSVKLSPGLKQEFWELNRYLVKRITDYGAVVAEEEFDYRDPKKHGKIIADMVEDIINKVQDFSLKVFLEQAVKFKERHPDGTIFGNDHTSS